MNVGIYIYDNAEVLDFSGPFEVFSTASRLTEPTDFFNVFLIGETGQSVLARGGYSVNPAYGFLDAPGIDLLIIVGGVHLQEMQKKNVLDWIALQAQSANLVASVCTGAFLLAAAGVLKHHHVTTHWEDITDLRASYPNLTVQESRRWVDAGDIITSGGISAGIDMSLHLVSKLHSTELAEKTARQMEFDWTKNA
ncbi:DJ-1/PfpI family protein [Sedimenticola selenatireducens]|uniref:DJ-1/PfpI family protein n=1 Tax=Sedimenticola selenatireducens TaxID=191960 RepID=A0A557SBX5_9GAMM|nr:DJ-1/PfpI family protein [Sedimenticola selenatireducens]TVO74913.1 DJ-1/PfpI family protein [Sedimenticola selenatireducens]TVT62449.1 MAG: DJ-1/PfpI family protein [Sedimenticola selenatireducens]